MSGYDVFEIALRRQFTALDGDEERKSLWSVEPRFIPATGDTERGYEGQPPLVEFDRDQLNQLRSDPMEYGEKLTSLLFEDEQLKTLFAEAIGETVNLNKKLRIRL